MSPDAEGAGANPQGGEDGVQSTPSDVAVAYVANGWPVFPLAGKAPAFRSPHGAGSGCRGECGQIGHGFHDATLDPDLARSWWAARPDRNIGGRCPERLVVLDVDPPEGDDTLARLQDRYGPLPETLTSYSGKGDGGRHLYYARPPGPLTGRRLRPGIDLIHHDLRYTVLPPSLHPKTGRPYAWADPQRPAAQPPMWLVRLLTPPPPQPPVRWTPASRSAAGLARWLARQPADPGTGRHDAVMWALATAYTEGAGSGEVEQIKAAALGLGKSQREVEAMAAWAAAHAAGGGGAR